MVIAVRAHCNPLDIYIYIYTLLSLYGYILHVCQIYIYIYIEYVVEQRVEHSTKCILHANQHYIYIYIYTHSIKPLW